MGLRAILPSVCLNKSFALFHVHKLPGYPFGAVVAPLCQRNIFLIEIPAYFPPLLTVPAYLGLEIFIIACNVVKHDKTRRKGRTGGVFISMTDISPLGGHGGKIGKQLIKRPVHGLLFCVVRIGGNRSCAEGLPGAWFQGRCAFRQKRRNQ